MGRRVRRPHARDQGGANKRTQGQNPIVTVLGFVGVAVLVVLSILFVRIITGQQSAPSAKEPVTQTPPANNTTTKQGQAQVDDWEPVAEHTVEEPVYEMEEEW